MYYGNPVTNETRLAAIDWPLLGIFGAEDTSIPVANVTAFESALTNASIEHDIQIYDGVGHAFANPSGNAYAAEEAMDAWARTLGFLDAHLR
jgi:carboxymethylenebutenolidase